MHVYINLNGMSITMHTHTLTGAYKHICVHFMGVGRLRIFGGEGGRGRGGGGRGARLRKKWGAKSQ